MFAQKLNTFLSIYAIKFSGTTNRKKLEFKLFDLFFFYQENLSHLNIIIIINFNDSIKITNLRHKPTLKLISVKQRKKFTIINGYCKHIYW